MSPLERGLELLSLRSEGALSPSEALELERLRVRQPELRRVEAEWSRIERALRAQVPTEPSSWRGQRVRRGVAQRLPGLPSRPPTLVRWSLGASLVGAGLLVLRSLLGSPSVLDGEPAARLEVARVQPAVPVSVEVRAWDEPERQEVHPTAPFELRF